MILGLEECLAGGVLNYFDQKGLVCLAVEGGSHDDPHTIDNLEAATCELRCLLWINAWPRSSCCAFLKTSAIRRSLLCSTRHPIT